MSQIRNIIKAVAASALVAALTTTPAVPADDQLVCVRTTGNMSIAACTRLIEGGRLAPGNLAIAYYNRGNGYNGKREYARAIADFTKAIELKPDYGVAYYNRGKVHETEGRKDLAIADYRKAAKFLPNYPQPLRALKRLGATP